MPRQHQVGTHEYLRFLDLTLYLHYADLNAYVYTHHTIHTSIYIYVYIHKHLACACASVRRISSDFERFAQDRPSPVGCGVRPSTIPEYRSRLVSIYAVHNPTNVAKVDYLLDKYKEHPRRVPCLSGFSKGIDSHPKVQGHCCSKASNSQCFAHVHVNS